MYNKYFIITYISHVYATCCVPIRTCTVAKDPDVAKTMKADSTATSRVGVAEEEDSDDVMDDSDSGQYTFHQYVYICCI